jgi:hypothetical protein
MTRALAFVALVASVPLFAACAPAPEMPAPITYAEAKKRVNENNEAWWHGMFPDEPMPVVEPIEYLEPDSSGSEVVDCMKDANLEGVSFGYNFWRVTGQSPSVMDPVNRAYFVCSMQYPYDISDPARMGMLSDAELDWIWDYNQTRLVPCLQLLGYTVINRPGDYIEGSGSYWIPYYEMAPMPASAAEWERIDLRCPPSPVGPPFYHPTSG